MEPKKVLVVANQTSAGSALRAELSRRNKQGPHVFTLIVPATPPQDHLVWTDDEASEVAQRRLDHALKLLREDGLDVDGRVGDASPALAIGDALLADSYDEIVLSTLPAGISKWLKQDLPDRIKRRFDLPLTVVEAEAAPSPVS